MRGISINAKQFRQIRQAQGLTQRELATRAGVGERTVRNAESGKRVRLDFMEFLSAALGVEVLDIIDDRDEMRVALRYQRRVDHILQAIAVLAERGDRSEYLGLLARDIRVCSPGPENIPFAGEYRGKDGVHRFFDRSAGTVAYDTMPKIFDIRTGGNLVVINGLDRLTAIPTGKSFSTPWMHVYEFENGLIARVDIWSDTSVVAQAYLPG